MPGLIMVDTTENLRMKKASTKSRKKRFKWEHLYYTLKSVYVGIGADQSFNSGFHLVSEREREKIFRVELKFFYENFFLFFRLFCSFWLT